MDKLTWSLSEKCLKCLNGDLKIKDSEMILKCSKSMFYERGSHCSEFKYNSIEDAYECFVNILEEAEAVIVDGRLSFFNLNKCEEYPFLLDDEIFSFSDDKSILYNCLYGMYAKEDGTIILENGINIVPLYKKGVE